MNENDADKSPEQIQNDIAHIRAQVSSTIDAIQSKLTPGQMMDQALDYFRGKGSSSSSASGSTGGGSAINVGAVADGASEFATSLGHAVRANPLPVAVIGLGVAWLMMSNRSGSSVPYDTVTGPRGSALYGRTSRVSSTGPRTVGMAGGSMSADYDDSYAAATDYGVGSDDATADSGPGVIDSVTAKVSDAGRTLRDKASTLADRARGATYSARDSLSSGASYAGDRASQLADRSREQFERARSGVSQMADEQPLVIAAFGIAIGAALGALLPSTRKEDELLGEKRDELLQTAKEAAQPHVDTIKESAMRVAEHAKQELQTVKETAKQEFQTVKETAKQEFQQSKDSVLSSVAGSGAPGSGAGGSGTGTSTGSGGGIGSNIAGATSSGGGSTSVGATGSTSGARTPSESMEHAHASSTTSPSTSTGSIDSSTDRGGRPV